MRLKWGLLLLMSIVVVWVVLNHFSTNSEGQSQHEQQQLTQEKKTKDVSNLDIGIPIPQELIDVVNEDIKHSSNKSLSEQQQILQEINTRMFSDDTYVELFSLESIVGICRESFALESIFEYGQGVIFVEQKKALAAFKDKCLTYETQYPQYLAKDRKQLLAGLKPQSKLGMLLEQRKDYSRMTETERSNLENLLLFEAIREQNSTIMVEVSFSYRFGQNMSGEFSTILASNDQNYIGHISQLAIVNMACQFQGGQNCDSVSGLMMLICSQQPESCGQDFHSWYEHNTLPGMKNDVDILINYYQSNVN